MKTDKTDTLAKKWTDTQAGKQRDGQWGEGRQDTKARLIHVGDRASASFWSFVTALSFDR